MQTYEVVIINPVDINSETIHERVTSVAAQVGGEIKNIDEWGDRKFTYPIKERIVGHYNTIDIDLEKNNLQEFKRLLSFEEDILRFMVIKKERES